MKLRSTILNLSFALSVGLLSAQSDNPCGAPTLNIGASCSFQSGTNVGSTNTTGVPAPGCASYSGPDVWYQVTVPANGSLSIDLNTGSITDGGMAWYSAASCNGPFTLIECDDDDSNNGLMPKITRSGMTPGQVIYVRIWRYGGGTGTFSICATSPTPPEDCIGENNFTCLTAQAFCTDMDDVTYCNTYGGGSSSSMGQYACLYSTPNPMWMYMQISADGSINIDLSQANMNGTGIDVDFALYGPYTSLAAGCAVIGPNTPAIDCSFSADYQEDVNVPHAQEGEIYIMLVTNYNGAQGTYVPGNAGSTGETDCSIVVPCSVSATSTPDTCSQGLGTVTAVPNGVEPPYTFSWNTPGNPTTPTVTGLLPGTYTVTVNGEGCENPATTTVTVGNVGATYSATSTPAACVGGNNGTATANYTSVAPGVTATYLWNDPAAQTTQTATGLTPGAYTCTITLSSGCSGTATVNVGFNTVTTTSSSTLVSCPGGNDGTATANSTSPGTLSYLWNDPLGQTTQTAVGLAAGPYTCTITSSVGCTSNVNVTVSEIPGMVATFTNISNVTCNSGNDGILTVNVTQGTAPYTYVWDNSTSTTHTANDLYAGDHMVTITDNRACVITMTRNLTEPAPLKVSFITPNTQICPEDDLQISATGAGGSSPYIFTWSSNGVVVGTGASITVDPTVTNTQYCVTLTEECGSPEADSCMVITFPTPIPPVLQPDKYEDCRPGEFYIENISSNINELATTYIDFGNNVNYTIPNGGDTIIVYNQPGTYTLQVINTSIYGCVYDTVLVDYFVVHPEPTANFYLGGNPATIFETTVQGHDLSSNDVVAWEWISPHSIPAHSNLESPKFTFPEGVEGIYPVTLIVTSQYGCTDTITVDAIVEDVIMFYVPNTFTPDGDEFNQSWKFILKGGDTYGFNLTVYNRWGEMVWETNDATVGWDGTYNGKPVQQGMYTWRASIKHKNDDGKDEYNGIVNVLR